MAGEITKRRSPEELEFGVYGTRQPHALPDDFKRKVIMPALKNCFTCGSNMDGKRPRETVGDFPETVTTFKTWAEFFRYATRMTPWMAFAMGCATLIVGRPVPAAMPNQVLARAPSEYQSLVSPHRTNRALAYRWIKRHAAVLHPSPLQLRYFARSAAIDIERMFRGKVGALPKLSGVPLGGRVPLVGDEVRTIEIKANPNKYLGRFFYLAGRLRLSDYYNYGYHQRDFTAFSLDPSIKGGRAFSSNSVMFYGFPEFVRPLSKIAIADHEAGRPCIVRVRCMLDPRRYEGKQSWNMIEVGIWQVLMPDGKSWSPPGSQMAHKIFDLSCEFGRPSAVYLLWVAEHISGGAHPRTASVVGYQAKAHLLLLPARDRRFVLGLINAQSPGSFGGRRAGLRELLMASLRLSHAQIRTLVTNLPVN
ncbi:MAG: hypothetical protein HKL95_01185 [Phycisphaerae bacterium]|nr:hypothetical protein [Phycisphaerae bacterium]